MSKISAPKIILHDFKSGRQFPLKDNNMPRLLKPINSKDKLVYFMPGKGKTMLSAESRQLKILNRIIRSTCRILGIEPVFPKLEAGKHLESYHTVVQFLRRTQRAVRNLKFVPTCLHSGVQVNIPTTDNDSEFYQAEEDLETVVKPTRV